MWPRKTIIVFSEMLRKWNDQLSCRLLTCKRMDGTFKLWYIAGYTVHLIPVQKY